MAASPGSHERDIRPRQRQKVKHGTVMVSCTGCEPVCSKKSHAGTQNVQTASPGASTLPPRQLAAGTGGALTPSTSNRCWSGPTRQGGPDIRGRTSSSRWPGGADRAVDMRREAFGAPGSATTVAAWWSPWCMHAQGYKSIWAGAPPILAARRSRLRAAPAPIGTD